jgi:Matrixin
MRRGFLIAAAALLLCSGASGYYHFVHFLTSTGSFAPIPEKFDLNALNGKTVQYFISDNGPAKLAGNDNLTALVSQIRLATKAWNDVPSSALRIAFGGFVPAGTVQNGPAIDVVFDDDIPPGLIAYGGPTSLGSDFVTSSKETFSPIAHSIVRIHRDLSKFPSYGEDLFLSIVHEFGHALGLQHTLTSAVMSTSITRGMTKAQPLGADDVAGVSVLYPTSAFLKNTGTLSGHVMMNGSGVNLASVVAISAAGPAISTLTNPDGSYILRGIPPGQGYYLYVHPLPPPLSVEITPANIVPPKDDSGQPIPATGYFDSQFYPGTRDPSQATLLSLKAGDHIDTRDFAVNPRSAPGISSVTTYGYWGANAVHPGPLVEGTSGSTMVATGSGLLSESGDAVAPGLTVSALGGVANVIDGSLAYYTGSYIMFGLAPDATDSMGLRHLFFTTPNDMYILPSAFLVVKNSPPSISSVTAADPDANGNPTAIVAGTNLDLTSRIFFDGIPARILGHNKKDQSLTVSVPAAPGSYQANVTALNIDLQSSLFVETTPVTYTYPSADAPSASVVAPALPAGSEAMVVISGLNIVDGQVSVGFGSSDVLVRKVWIKDSKRVWLNVSVNPAATAEDLPVTITSGLQTIYTQAALHIADHVDGQLVLQPGLVNAATGSVSLWPGAVAIVNVSNLNAPPGSLALFVADQRATVYWSANGQLAFQVPANLSPGSAVLRLQTAQNNFVLPIVIDIDPQPPIILAALNGSNVQIDASHATTPGNIVVFAVAGLGDTSAISDPSVLHFSIGGEDHPAVMITNQNKAGAKQHPFALIEVVLAGDVQEGAQVPVTITWNGLTSPVFYLSIGQ